MLLPTLQSPDMEFTIYREENGNVAVGCRGCRLSDGRLIVSFMTQTKLGSNDFRPMLICSTDSTARYWESPIEPFGSLTKKYSIFGQVSKGNSEEELLFFGAMYERAHEDELFWNEELCALKTNQLFWCKSKDKGRTWSEPRKITHPFECSAETTSPIQVTRSGRWLACFSPYPTTTQKSTISTNQVLLLISDDNGETWRCVPMLSFEVGVCGAEAWVVELSDGTLLATSWQVNQKKGGDPLPNAFAVSHNGGESWSPTASTEILGQSTSLMAHNGGHALFAYNQRLRTPYGIGVAKVRPDQDSFGIVTNVLAWSSDKNSTNRSNEFKKWTDFSFGEPSFVRLESGDAILMFWKQDELGYLIAGVPIVSKS